MSRAFDAALWDSYAQFFDAEEGTVFPVDRFELRFHELMRKRYGGRALEIGAGCGRLATSLAGGCITAALEPSAGMLSRWNPGDALLASRVRALGQEMPFVDDSFMLVTFPYNGLHCLTDSDERISLLHEAGRLIAPGGVLVLETCPLFISRPEESAADRYDFFNGRMRLKLVETVRKDLEAGLISFEMSYYRGDGGRSDLRLELSLISQEALLMELDLSGLEPLEIWGDYDFAPFVADESPRMLTVASRKDYGCQSSCPP